MLRLSRGNPDRERQAIRHMHENGASGLLLFPIGASHDMRSLRLSDKLRLPFVLIDRHYSGVPASSVVSDNYNGAAAAARELLLRGHGRIALLTPPDEHSVIAERLAGFSETLLRHGGGHPPELRHVMPYPVIHGPREASIRQLLPWLRQHRGTFTAMVVLDRELALIARDALGALAAPLPPADMVTFDDPGLPGISYIKQNETAIGERAVGLLMAQIQRPGAERRVMIVPTELVVPQAPDVIENH
jgi:DNA-binding LacI/PurR family transcriptional regulator